ncbi:MAG: chloride channel protein [Bacteroidales bacterium]
MMKKVSLLRRLLIWRVRHVSNYNFILILSVIVGLVSGLAAVLIKNSVHLIQAGLTNFFSKEYANYLYFAYPTIGVLLALLFIRYVVKHKVDHGIPGVLSAIATKKGKIHRHNMFSSVVSSALTVGFGGSVGLEGPTVATGAAYGSNIASLAHIEYKDRLLLIACATAGAMSAIFKSPIAAVVFSMEIIMLDLTMRRLVPLIMSSATAALTSYFFLGQDVLYPFELQETFSLPDIPFYIVLGVLTGFASVYFTEIYVKIAKLFERFKNIWKRLVIGGIALGVLIFLVPSLYGEGYEAINACLKGDFSYLFDNSIFYNFKDNMIAVILLLIVVVLLKVVAASITFGIGGIGGIFAPTLFMGANLGLLFAVVVNYLGFFDVNSSNFALVGMAGMIAGVLHGPLTAIFLIAEITSGYGLFMPLMITAAISYVTVKVFESNSVYTIQLAKRGELLTHHKDKQVLKLMSVKPLVERDFSQISIDASLRDLVGVIAKAKRNIFPVVDEQGLFYGLIRMDDIRDIMFKPELYDKVQVKDMLVTPSFKISLDESMEEVTEKFSRSGNFNMVVVKDDKYVGFVSRAKVFSTYRRLLKQFSED